jgi:3-dehydroquinate synthase
MDIGSNKSFAMSKQVPSPIHPIWSSDPWVQVRQHIDEVEPDKLILLCDTNTYRDCYNLFCEAIGVLYQFDVIVIPAGEKNKNIETATIIWKELSRFGASRNSLLINLGGGMVCDIGAFCASTFHRGIPYIHVPTSLLAMVDAAIGGKNGIDLGDLKNMIGTINFPVSVMIETEFLKTLPELELRSGYAEMLKQIIIADQNAWKNICIQSSDIWNDILWLKTNINLSIDIKMDIVSTDPFEKNIRKRLNFGHTVGHGIESYYLSKGFPIPHGHAVAAGMQIESYLSENLRILDQYDRMDIEHVICRYFDKLDFQVEDIEQIIQFMKSDKKNKEKKFSFSLIYAIGDVRENYMIEDASVIKNAFIQYINRETPDNE